MWRGLNIRKAEGQKFILFVCCGNRERSVIAERLLRKRLIDKFPELTERVMVRSAGIIPREYLRHAEAKGVRFQPPHFGKNPNIYALQYLAGKGIDVSLYRSQELTKDMAMEADLILAIDQLIKKAVLDLHPETQGKVFTFKEFVFGASWQDLDIGDPMKLPDIDEETGTWIWPEGYPDSYIAEIEKCLAHGIDKFVQYIKDS